MGYRKEVINSVIKPADKSGGPVTGKSSHWIAATLAKRSGANPDPVQIGDATIAIWFEIATALESIIGRQGVAALYDRSIALTSRSYPWLTSSRAQEDHIVDLNALQSIIAQQPPERAAAGAGELLQSFYDVLVSLVGRALSDQLLGALKENSAAPRSGDM